MKFFFSYKLRIESMLLKAEFETNKSFLEVSQQALLEAGKELMICPKLQDLFYIILIAGNFLNSVSLLFFALQNIIVIFSHSFQLKY